MSTQNKIKVKSPGFELDLMYSGCSLRLWYTDPATAGLFPKGLVEYRILGNRKSLKISRLMNDTWSSLIPEDLTMNPLAMTEEEVFMVSILPNLNSFERELYSFSGNVVRMWHNNADDDYVKSYVKEFIRGQMEQVI